MTIRTCRRWIGPVLACLLVVFYHCVFYAQPEKPHDDAFGLMTVMRVGWLGVPMFFVISGYCISATADNSRRKGHGLRQYFWRRFRRIFPPVSHFFFEEAARPRAAELAPEPVPEA